ncbi:neuropeptide Y receptor type 6-like [Actinia tenebrosa]|uniref:Neuropeptide Y receptor type 6-like n=1 Tax=Actinia tenebrosa TaxID=6105 RepID=A0A6P8HHA8_ACTTE|nr:neuropeptide Y receptor type 6-like [Actinia tenebrosa]
MKQEMANDSSSPGDSNSFILVSNSNQSYSNPADLEWRGKLGIDITIFVVAVIGNLAVLVVIYTTRERRKTPFEILIANLSVADILSVLLYSTIQYFNIPLSKWYCKLVAPFFSSTQMVSVLTMTTIAIFRCRSIVYPFKTKPSMKLTYCTVAGLWLVANICLLPVYIVREQNQGRCEEIWPSELLNKVYTVSLFVVQYMIPLTIIAISYTKIILYLKRHKVSRCGLNSDRIKQLKMTRKRDLEVIKISFIIVLLYNISTLPGQIAWIVWIVFERYEMALVIFKFSYQLLLFHSCCNPFVYGTISREFRSRFVQVFWSIFCCICKMRKTKTVVLQTEQGHRNNACVDLEIIDKKE